MEPLFQRHMDFTVTSAQVPTSIETIDVRLCAQCSHVQSQLIEDLSRYYDSDYNFHLSEADTDDLYIVRDGTPVYRSQHQLEVLLAEYNFGQSTRVLDYGCGKAGTLRALSEACDAVTPLVFDVSAAYTPHWDEFVEERHQAVHDIPENWNGTCDLVLSFFALEHVADPRLFSAEIERLLRPGGRVHLLVPNMYENINDILVVDHVNHFSPGSLRLLFANAGFEDIEVRTDDHRAALLLTARKPLTKEISKRPGGTSDTKERIDGSVAAARAIAARCEQMFATIDANVEAINHSPVVIYGSGIYGMMILASIRDRRKVLGFLDNNRFKQGSDVFGIPVLAPQDIPADAQAILVGLNPEFAREIIASMEFLTKYERDVLYL